MLKAVVFDLDGTLIDSTEAILQSFVHTFRVANIEPPARKTIRDTISMPLESQFEQLCGGDPVELCGIYREHYFETSPDNTVLLPGVTESLELIRDEGLRMAVATSKSVKGSEILLRHLAIYDFFEFIVGADSVQRHKPDPEALELTMERMGLCGDEMVYVGDTHYDTEACKRAGVDCVAVATGYATHEELVGYGPCEVSDSMLEAASYIIRSYR